MRRKLRVYLDQNKWIELLRAKGDSPARETLSLLSESISREVIVCPLSASHYLETWHRSDWESRHRLAGLMRDLSGYAAIAPIHTLQRLEVEAAVLEHLTSMPRRPFADICAIGYGVNHAFASPTGRLRFVETVATDSSPDGPPADVPRAFFDDLALIPDKTYQWWSLAGFEESMRMDGLDVITQHRRGQRWAEDQQAVMDSLTHPASRADLDDIVATGEIIDLLDDINIVCKRFNLDPHNLPITKGRAATKAFIEHIPTRACVYHFKRLRHRNQQHRWTQHDFADIMALSVAIPYCDVVVTEKQWVHLAKTAGLGERYDTLVCSKLSDLKTWLAENC
ncbi:hypothetical protein GCM10023191_005670 [Actinoallomurus oryzae]|uniref:PIN domain-containing protein n=1 Tax=Actinoallomurus oryzae TaxID=502180 RepID=A0ABP8P8P9_9ACTN